MKVKNVSGIKQIFPTIYGNVSIEPNATTEMFSYVPEGFVDVTKEAVDTVKPTDVVTEQVVKPNVTTEEVKPKGVMTLESVGFNNNETEQPKAGKKAKEGKK